MKIAFLSESEHETLKFGICGVDFPPPGSYFKSFAKIAIFMTCCFEAVFGFSRVDFPPTGLSNLHESAQWPVFPLVVGGS